jgi:formylglycine-generating enzyme required for sulfatase activity
VVTRNGNASEILRVIIVLLLIVAAIPAGACRKSISGNSKGSPKTTANPTLPELPRSNYSEDLGNGIQLDMVWIPAGNFVMGSPDNETGRNDDEGPQTNVNLDGYWMGKYEVTQAQYQAIMGTNPSRFSGANNPVEKVSWNDAMEFCRKLSDRTGDTFALPTEAQLEYACRAGSITSYSFGNDAKELGNYAWWFSNSDRATHPVGQKQPNTWGLYDMHGNVWEWSLSLYEPYPYSETDGRNSLSETSEGRAMRGGTWSHINPDGFRCACRVNFFVQLLWSPDVGFRCARNP